MGEFADQVWQDIEAAIEDVAEWGENLGQEIARTGEDIVDWVSKLDDQFVALGEWAAEIYEQAEQAIGDAAAELYAFGDLILAEAMQVGKDVENALLQVEDWAVEAIGWLETALNDAGQAFVDLGEEIENSPAFQKTKLFIMGAVEEVSQFANHLYTSAEKIWKKVESDGLHVVLAEGIEYLGEKAGEITSEFFVKKVGGFIGKDIGGWVLSALGMEKEAKELKKNVTKELENMASFIDKQIVDTANTFG